MSQFSPFYKLLHLIVVNITFAKCLIKIHVYILYIYIYICMYVKIFFLKKIEYWAEQLNTESGGNRRVEILSTLGLEICTLHCDKIMEDKLGDIWMYVTHMGKIILYKVWVGNPERKIYFVTELREISHADVN